MLSGTENKNYLQALLAQPMKFKKRYALVKKQFKNSVGKHLDGFSWIELRCDFYGITLLMPITFYRVFLEGQK